MSGTTPQGIEGERQISLWVRDMFGKVAPRYDLLNHLLSLNIDRLWRNRTVQLVQPILDRPGAVAVDLCCGTGDLTIALQRGASAATILGSDFCHPMLRTAKEKMTERRLPSPLFEADALRLPLRDSSVDLLTVAFGFRNLANYEAGLLEMRRVLRPEGVAAILEFSQPPNKLFASFYNFYSMRVLPKIAGVVSGAPDAYTYLPESVRKFPGAEGLAHKMEQAGFRNVTFDRMTFGVVALHRGQVTRQTGRA